MIWETILAGRWLETTDLVPALSDVFAVPPQDAQVVELEDDFRVSENTQVLVERRPLRGEFRAALEIVLRGPGPERIAGTVAREALVGQLCNLWQCECLISDDTVNPYRWVLVRPEGSPQIVHLDDGRLEEEEYVVRSRRSRPRAKPRLSGGMLLSYRSWSSSANCLARTA